MFSIVKPADKSNGRLSDYKGNKVGQPFNQEMIPTDCDNEYTFPRLQGLLEILTFFRLYKNRTISSTVVCTSMYLVVALTRTNL